MMRLFYVCAMSLAIAATPAFAKDNGKGKGHGKGNSEHSGSHKSGRGGDWDRDDHRGRGDWDHNDDHHGRRDWDHNDDHFTINLNFNQRQAVYDRLEPYYVRKCPPGLAKKHNGCLPPGHAKQYVIGQPLPAGVTWWPVPSDVLMTLPPAPYGAQYVWVDRDVLLVTEATKKVLDAVVLLSAVH